jgi:hypothetical protein
VNGYLETDPKGTGKSPESSLLTGGIGFPLKTGKSARR